MKVTELRIGNRFQLSDRWFELNKELYNTPKIQMVQRIDYDYLLEEHAFNGYSIEAMNPIPLTEEWLLKFGFTKEKNKPSKHHNKYFSKWINDYKYSFSYAPFRKDWGFYHSYTDAVDEKDNNKFDFISCGIKYVHQLQNLCFALTGEELTINTEIK